jgi:hypothetical protein
VTRPYAEPVVLEDPNSEQLDEAERLLGYYEAHGGQFTHWTDDVVALLCSFLPDWSAYKKEDG